MHLLFVKLQHSFCSCFCVTLVTIVFSYIVFTLQVLHKHVIFRTHVFAVGTLNEIPRVSPLVNLQTWEPLRRIIALIAKILLGSSHMLVLYVLLPDSSVLQNFSTPGLSAGNIGVFHVNVSFQQLFTFELEITLLASLWFCLSQNIWKLRKNGRLDCRFVWFWLKSSLNQTGKKFQSPSWK